MGQRLSPSALTRRPSRLRRARAFVFAAAFASATITFGASAFADDAGEHAKRARAAYDLQNWPTAIQEYEAAYAADQKPEYMFGLAQAQRQAGDYTAAIASFKAYKRSDSVTPQQATAAELLITKCEADEANKEAQAAQHKNDAQPAAASTAAPPPSQSGAATAPPPEQTSTPPKHFYQDVFGDALFVVGVGAAAVGTVFLITGNSDMSATTQAPTYNVADANADKARTKQVVGTLLMAGGGVFIAGAVVRWLTMKTSSDEHARAAGLFIGPTGIGYSGRF